MGQGWDDDIAGEYDPGPPDPTKPNARKPHWIPVVITRQEIRELLAAPDMSPLDLLTLRTLYASGLRGKELAGLKPEHVHPETGTLRFGRRVALVDPETCQALANLDWSTWTWNVSRLKELVKRAAKRCKLGKRYAAMGRELLPQALRVAFAAHCLEDGAGLFALHNLLGYKNLDDTEDVIEISVGLWRSAYDKAHPLASGAVGQLRGGGHQSDLTLEDVLLMLGALGEGVHHTHNSLVVRTIYAAGLRVNELVDLLVADIEVDEGRLFLRKAKEAKDRYSLIDRQTAELLRPLVEGQSQDMPLFAGAEDYLVRQWITKAAEATGLTEKFPGKTLSPHTFRHAHATHLYYGGMEPDIIKKLLGHKSVEETMGYVACGPEEWRAAYDRVGLLKEILQQTAQTEYEN